MRRVLVVAYYFPPIGGIGSIRLARFAELLPQHGWEPNVQAPRDTPHASDPDLRFPEERVIRSNSIELSQLGRAVVGARSANAVVTGSDGPSARAMLRTFAHRYVFFPDAQVGWYPGAVVAGLRALRRERFDAIYSTSYPMTAHLVARTLSRRSGLPWLAEHRDPWCERLFADHPYRRLAERLERTVARDATALAMPTPTWAEHYGALWHADVAVLPNGFDVALPERREPVAPTLTYVGTYLPREHDLSTLWEALARIREQSPASMPRIRFVGRLPDALRDEIATAGLADVLDCTGFVSHDDAMRELMSASVLIASGVPGVDARRRGWVPAKLFEYLASGLPVVYVADADTDAAEILSGHAGVHVVAPGDVSGAVAAVRASLTDGVQQRDVAHLSREAGASRLAELLDGMARR